MSIRAIDWVFQHSNARLSARSVLLAIAYAADESGGNAKVTKATLAAKTGYDESTVRRALRILEEIGELERRRLGNGHPVYKVIMNPLPDRPSLGDEPRVPAPRPAPPPNAPALRGSARKQDEISASTLRFHLPPGTRWSMDVMSANDDRDGSNRV